MAETTGSALQEPLNVPPNDVTVQFLRPRNITYIDPPYTVYPIEIEYASLNLRWRTKKRFSDFVNFNTRLQAEATEKNWEIDIPTLPSKTWRRNIELTFINERREALNEYMQTLLDYPETGNSVSFMTFVGLIEDQTKIRADRARMHLDHYLVEAQTGDIVLFKTQGFLSSSLRGITNSDFDHVAVVIKLNHDKRPVVSLLEATTDGVIRYDLWQRLSQWNMVDAQICVRQLLCERTKEFQKVAQSFMTEVNGLDYKITVGKLLRKTESEEVKIENAHHRAVPENEEEERNEEEVENNTYFCSELIANMYKLLGILDNSPGSKACSAYWPSSFSSRNGPLDLINAELTDEIDIYFQKPAIDRARIL